MSCPPPPSPPAFLAGIPEGVVVVVGSPGCPHVYQVSEQFGSCNFSFFLFFSFLLSSVPKEGVVLGPRSADSPQSYVTVGGLTRAYTKLCFKTSKSCCCLLALWL